MTCAQVRDKKGVTRRVGAEHSACLFLIDAQTPCQFDPGDAGSPHLQVESRFERRLHRHSNRMLSPLRLGRFRNIKLAQDSAFQGGLRWARCLFPTLL